MRKWLKKNFGLTETRKFFLVIWMLVIIFPSIFLVGKVIEGHTYQVIDKSYGRHGLVIETKEYQWSDLRIPFLIIFFATICLYWMSGIEDINQNPRRRKS